MSGLATNSAARPRPGVAAGPRSAPPAPAEDFGLARIPGRLPAGLIAPRLPPVGQSRGWLWWAREIAAGVAVILFIAFMASAAELLAGRFA